MTNYIGRFAPSPTGPLHAGSLVSALASWVDARHHHGQWLLRIEDIDPPREVAGATKSIIRSLQQHGLHWDGDITCQSTCSKYYETALQYLRNKKLIYACQCTRKNLRALASQNNTTAYPGTCRDLHLPETDKALRLRITDGEVAFTDLHAGPQRENVANTCGDFIVRRRGPLYAYQLAVVVDDARQHITHIVRGSDLLDNTARQIALQSALGYQPPQYLHLPVVKGKDGRKLSKQTGANALDDSAALENLRQAWAFLGQPALPAAHNTDQFLQAAISHWQRNLIPEC